MNLLTSVPTFQPKRTNQVSEEFCGRGAETQRGEWMFPGLGGDAVHVWRIELDLSEPEVSERLAVLSAADFAFVPHGFHYLKDEGVMVIILPHA
jgi:hypothetical protein